MYGEDNDRYKRPQDDGERAEPRPLSERERPSDLSEDTRRYDGVPERLWHDAREDDARDTSEATRHVPDHDRRSARDRRRAEAEAAEAMRRRRRQEAEERLAREGNPYLDRQTDRPPRGQAHPYPENGGTSDEAYSRDTRDPYGADERYAPRAPYAGEGRRPESGEEEPRPRKRSGCLRFLLIFLLFAVLGYGVLWLLIDGWPMIRHLFG